VAVPTYSDLKDLAFDRAQLNTSRQALACTLNSTTTVTSAALFGSVVAGMQVTGTGIPVGTTVQAVATTSSLTLTIAATLTQASTLTFYALDSPVTDVEFARFINDALRDVWEMSGGRMKNVASATAWNSAQTATGVVTGILTDIAEIIHVWASGTSGSVGATATDVEVERKDLSYIQFLRANAAGFPTYLVPKFYALTRLSTVTPASVNLLQLDYWPSVTGFYLPIKYMPQWQEIDGTSVTTPDLDDIWARDGGLLCARRLAASYGREEFIPGIEADYSQRMQEALARKQSSKVDAKQQYASVS
jgi:hypothetical protein